MQNNLPEPLNRLTIRKCDVDGCDRMTQAGETYCDPHLMAGFVLRALEINPATVPAGCLHPANCSSRHIKNFTQCEECSRVGKETDS